MDDCCSFPCRSIYCKASQRFKRLLQDEMHSAPNNWQKKHAPDAESLNELLQIEKKLPKFIDNLLYESAEINQLKPRPSLNANNITLQSFISSFQMNKNVSSKDDKPISKPPIVGQKNFKSLKTEANNKPTSARSAPISRPITPKTFARKFLKQPLQKHTSVLATNRSNSRNMLTTSNKRLNTNGPSQVNTKPSLNISHSNKIKLKSSRTTKIVSPKIKCSSKDEDKQKNQPIDQLETPKSSKTNATNKLKTAYTVQNNAQPLTSVYFEDKSLEQPTQAHMSGEATDRSYMINMLAMGDNIFEAKRKFFKEYKRSYAADVIIGECLDDIRKYMPHKTAVINATDNAIQNILRTLDKKYPKDGVLKRVKNEELGNIIETLKKTYPKDVVDIKEVAANIELQWQKLKSQLDLNNLKDTQMEEFLDELGKEFPHQKSMMSVTQENIQKIIDKLSTKYPEKDVARRVQAIANKFGNRLQSFANTLVQPNAGIMGNAEIYLQKLRNKYPDEKALATANHRNIITVLENLKEKYPNIAGFIGETQKNIEHQLNNTIAGTVDMLKAKYRSEAMENVTHLTVGQVFEQLKRKYPQDMIYLNETEHSMIAKLKDLKIFHLTIESPLGNLRKQFPLEFSLFRVTYENIGKTIEGLIDKFPTHAAFIRKEEKKIDIELNADMEPGLEHLKDIFPKEKNLNTATHKNIFKLIAVLKTLYPSGILAINEAEKNIENYLMNSIVFMHPIDETVRPILEKLEHKFPKQKSALASAKYNNLPDILSNLKRKFPHDKAFIEAMETEINLILDEYTNRILDNLKKSYPKEEALQNAKYKNITNILENLRTKYRDKARRARFDEVEKNIERYLRNAKFLSEKTFHNILDQALQPFLDVLRNKFPFEKFSSNITHTDVGDKLEKLKKRYRKETDFISNVQKNINLTLDGNIQPLYDELRTKYPDEQLLKNITHSHTESILHKLREKYPDDRAYLRDVERIAVNHLLELEFYSNKTFDYYLNLSIQPIITKLRKNFPGDRCLNNITHSNIREVLDDLRRRHPHAVPLIKDVADNVERNFKSLKLANDATLNKCLDDVIQDLKRIFPQEKKLNYVHRNNIADILTSFKQKYPDFKTYIEEVEKTIDKTLQDCEFAKNNPYDYNLEGNLQPLLEKLRKKFPNEAVLYEAHKANIESILEALSTKYPSDITISYKPNGDVADIFVNVSKSDAELNEAANRPSFAARSIHSWERILAARRKIIQLIRRRTGKNMCDLLMNQPVDENLIEILKELLDDEIRFESRYKRKTRLAELRKLLSELNVCQINLEKIPAINKRHIRCFAKHEVPHIQAKLDRNNWQYDLLQEAKQLERFKLKTERKQHDNNKYHIFFSKENPSYLYVIDDKEFHEDTPPHTSRRQHRPIARGSGVRKCYPSPCVLRRKK